MITLWMAAVSDECVVRLNRHVVLVDTMSPFRFNMNQSIISILILCRDYLQDVLIISSGKRQKSGPHLRVMSMATQTCKSVALVLT